MTKHEIIDRDALRKDRLSVDDYRGLTLERLRQAHGMVEEGNDKFGNRTHTIRDTPIDRLRIRGQISAREYAALHKFRTHWYYAGLEASCGSVDLNRVFASDPSNFSGMSKTEKQAFHRQKYREAVREVGLRASAVIENVVCAEMSANDAGERLGYASPYRARRAAIDYLRDAGYRLAKLWDI